MTDTVKVIKLSQLKKILDGNNFIETVFGDLANATVVPAIKHATGTFCTRCRGTGKVFGRRECYNCKGLGFRAQKGESQ